MESAEMKESLEHYKVTQEFLSQPGETFEVTKIHPYDLMEMSNNAGPESTLYFLDNEPGGILLINGKAYFQTVCVPAKTKNIK